MRFYGVILLLLFCGQLFSQGELDTQDKIFWRNERSFGGSLNSDGMSVIYRELRQIKPSNRVFLEAGFGVLKHPKEIKLSNYYFQSSGSFVFGKLNSTWVLNAGGGYHQEIFEKHDLGGVSISWFAGGGAALTLAKPIYYKIVVALANNYYTISEEKFDITEHQPDLIIGRASFFKGFNEIKAYPGLYCRGGFNFEYSASDKMTHSLELGFTVNAFASKIPIMAIENNRRVYPALFVSYRLGIILDPLHPGSFFPSLFKNKEEE